MARLFHLCITIPLIFLLVMCSTVQPKDSGDIGGIDTPEDTEGNGGTVFQMDNVKLEHLIKISYGDNTYIFHGFFLKQKNGFSVFAFGDFDVPLFTLTSKNNIISYMVHIDDFKDKFDFKHVGEDIWRIYFAETRKDIARFGKLNEGIIERNIELRYDNKNNLINKYFYNQEYKKIITINYDDYEMINGVILPGDITYENTLYQYKIKVLTVNCSPVIN